MCRCKSCKCHENRVRGEDRADSGVLDGSLRANADIKSISTSGTS
jgi:hypothetical protein